MLFLALVITEQRLNAVLLVLSVFIIIIIIITLRKNIYCLFV